MSKAIAPMLASPMSKADINDWNDWMMEEKYDGHRLVVVKDDASIVAYTRERKHAGVSGKSQLTRDLPAHLVAEFKRLPNGAYDGELLAMLPDGTVGTSTDVPRTELQSSLRFVAFDVLMTPAGSCMMQSYECRRALLTGMIKGWAFQHVVLAEARECVDSDAVATFCHEVWDRGGEGLILKRKAARYTMGKRSLDFIKIKKLLTLTGKIVGFEATRGTVMNRGAYASVVLDLEDGRRTTVKTKNDAELAKFNRHTGSPATHPDLGRVLRIEYQDDAADGGVRHPRWDHWIEDEND